VAGYLVAEEVLEAAPVDGKPLGEPVADPRKTSGCSSR
jgi:hypothetical protein